MAERQINEDWDGFTERRKYRELPVQDATDLKITIKEVGAILVVLGGFAGSWMSLSKGQVATDAKIEIQATITSQQLKDLQDKIQEMKAEQDALKAVYAKSLDDMRNRLDDMERDKSGHKR
jgi:hypothetical protein